MSFNKKHPECLPDEVFITNTDQHEWRHIGWKTKRKGNTAYDTDGKPLGNRWAGSFPVFAKKSEIRDHDPKVLERLEA